jgi:hypothetical protein
MIIFSMFILFIVKITSEIEEMHKKSKEFSEG